MPQKITNEHVKLGLEIGDQIPVPVFGTYSDGSIVDLSKSTQTTYVSASPGIARVTNEGLVTAVGPGSTQIVIDERLSVPVTVEPLIQITPAQATLKASQTRKFVSRVTKPVTRPPNDPVTWSLDPPVGSVVHGLYTAPAAIDSLQTVRLTATSVDDRALTATAVITLSPAVSVYKVRNWVLYAAQTQQYSSDTAGVTWSISPVGAGSISDTGLYVARSSIAALQKVTITATSAKDPANSDSTTIWISPRPFALFLWAPSLTLTRDSSSATNITVLATNGFSHPLGLSVSELPAGVTGSFAMPTVQGNNQTSLTFIASPEAVPGTYQVTVQARDTVYPALSDSKSLTVTIGD